ncbi:MAG: hypothetical protein JWP95_1457, partial [Actinotalea sp.]|nr:hypothetical protein [Actinotalea sp.]
GPGGDPAGWSLSRWGRPGTTLSMSEPTGAPVVLDGARPLVLTSSALHGLTAFDATDPDTVVWRFRPRGTVLGGPVVDPATGDVYVGSSGRRLSKLSRDGMFLWSHETGDNVAARPVLVDDVVVVPGEDATVQGLDAVTGAVLWSVRTTGPMVSSPALADGVVAMGSDSGAVHGLDPATGEEVWRFDAGDPVEAPVVADGRRFLVTTATGLRIALDAATGEELWSRETGVDQRSGAVVDGATMLLVDSSGGWMAAYSTEDGAHRWTSEVSDLVGAPVVLDGIAYARDRAGLVHALDVEDGAEVASWDPADGAFAADGGSTARFGLAAGAGALWMSDDSTVLRRLGPPSAGDADPLVPVWSATGSDAPFDSTFDTTPAAWRDAVLYLDHSRGVFRVDPATGEAERLGTMPGEGFAATGPVVSGDVLLATGVDGLQAASLPGLEPLWSVPLPSTVLQPPAVGDGVVVVALASGSDDAGVAQGSVQAMDLVDGRLLWSADLGDVMFAAGAAVEGSVVHVAGRALDLRTGTELWRTPIEDALPSGGTSVGDGLVVGAVLSPDAQDGALVAWSADGELLWRSTEPGFGLDITEQPHVAPSAVVAASFDGSVVGHDRETGERRWDWRPPAAGTYGGIATVGDRVWVMTLEARVYVLDAASGEPVASFTALDIPLESSDVAQRPAAVRDVVVLPLGFVLLALPAADGAV